MNKEQVLAMLDKDITSLEGRMAELENLNSPALPEDLEELREMSDEFEMDVCKCNPLLLLELIESFEEEFEMSSHIWVEDCLVWKPEAITEIRKGLLKRGFGL